MGNIKKQKKSFSHLNKDALADLLMLCVDLDTETIAPDTDQYMAERLQDLLAQSLPQMIVADPTSQWDQVYALSGLETAVGIRELLLHPETDIPVLQRIQKHGKTLVREGASSLEQELGSVLYHAAIASALVWRGQRISKLTSKSLETYWQRLLQAVWLPTDLSTLFRKACERLHQTH